MIPGLALVAGFAEAACPLNIAHFRVGADTTYCNYTDIQAAIDAANTVNACPVIIDITNEYAEYTDTSCDPNKPGGCHLTISGKNVTLQGRAAGESCYTLTQCIPGPSCPAPASTAPLVTLDGASNGRVLNIANSNVNIRNLRITHGDAGSGSNGGGINFTGTGNLNITRSAISQNKAGYGAGISVTASGGSVSLRLQTETQIANNIAQTSGGGIRIEGSTRLYAQSDQTLITLNHALTGYGGGIEILGPARADIGSPGYLFAGRFGVVSSNQALYGGGIAVADSGSGEGVLRTYAHDAANPTSISDNSADNNGGGIYLSGQSDACLFASRVNGNVAQYGAAIYETSYNGSSFVADVGVYINGGMPARLGAECGPESIADLGGVKDCLPYDAACSTISDNTALNPDASPSPGDVLGASGDLFAQRFRMSGNTAYQLIASTGSLDASRCLLTGNNVAQALIRGFNQVKRLHSCTIAGNTIGDPFVMQFYEGYTSVDLAYDIIAQPGKSTVNWQATSGYTFDVSYTLSNSTAGLPQDNPSVVQGAPVFVDAGSGDYHLEPTPQLAIDFGQGGNFDFANDLDNAATPVDLVQFPNYLSGSADLGAYERQNAFYNCGDASSVFCDGFDH